MKKQLLFIASLGLFGLSDMANAQVMIKDIQPGTFDSDPKQITNVNGTLFFSANQNSGITGDPVIGNSGVELWKSDGTDAGTVLIKNLNPNIGSYNSPVGSFPTQLTDVNGTLFFRAYSTATSSSMSGQGLNADELWKSDGTEVGTIMLKDFGTNPTAAERMESLMNVNGTLFFVETTSGNGKELWKSDGTPVGTVMVKDINLGAGSSHPRYLTNVNDTLFFAAAVGSWFHLFKTDGTDAGTVQITNANQFDIGSQGTATGIFANVNGTLFFEAWDISNGIELWKSDGTSAGTVLVKDINPGQVNSTPRNFTNVNDTLFFTALGALWKSDGTDAGTVQVQTITGTIGSLTAVNDKLYFRVKNVNNYELWVSDGTSAGTFMLKTFVKDINTNANLYNLTSYNDSLFFTADDGVHGYELWKTDGTVVGTQMLPEIYQKPNIYNTGPSFLTVMDDVLYFNAQDTLHGNELWKYPYGTVGSSANAPTLLSATAISPSQIDLSWTDNSNNENGFKVERSTDGINFTEIQSLGADVISYSDMGLANATTYHYRVFAYNLNGNSTATNVDSATTFSITTTIYEIAEDEIKLYPNPSQGKLFLDVTSTPVSVKIRNITGQVVYTEKIFNNNQVIDLQQLSNGIYMMQVSGNSILHTEKIVIQK